MVRRNSGAACVLAIILFSAIALNAKTVTLESADNRTNVSLNLGDTLVVDLPSGNVPGFRWTSNLPRPSVLTPLNQQTIAADKNAGTVEIIQFRFNAATIGDTVLPFGFESASRIAGVAPPDTSAFSVLVHIASGAPNSGSAILFGVYQGNLPCADCSGLDTVLRLYAKSKYDTTYAFYVRTQTYRGAPHGDLTFSDRGDWAVLKGDAVNPNATVYQLNSGQHAESLLVQENGAALVQLGHDQKPIDTKRNMTLRRISQPIQ